MFMRALASGAADPQAPPMYLILVGGPADGPEAAELRDEARRLGFLDRLRIVGSVPDPKRYYGAIDIAVNSFLGKEGFGLSVVEAMLMRRPVIVHASGGPAEIVPDGIAGWHAETATEAGFAAAIRRALADRLG